MPFPAETPSTPGEEDEKPQENQQPGKPDKPEENQKPGKPDKDQKPDNTP